MNTEKTAEHAETAETRCLVSAISAISVVCSLAACLLISSPAAAQSVTYTKDVAPLLDDRCGMCHHPGGSAPFSLLTYADAKRHAAQIAKVTARALHAAVEGRSRRRSVRRPASAERRRDRAAAAVGGRRRARRRCSQSQSAVRSPQSWTDGWQLGKPDLVITLPQPYTLPAEGTDAFHIFVLPIPVDRARFVRGLEFRPGNPRVVHHANIRIDTTPASRRLDEAGSGPGLRRADRAVGDVSRRPFPRLDAGPGRRRCCRTISPGASSRTPTSSSSCTCSRAASRSRSRRRSACTSATDAADARRRRCCGSGGRTSTSRPATRTTSSPTPTRCRSTSRSRRCSRTRTTARATCAARRRCRTARRSR